MTFTPFFIRCTTCEVKLAVRGPALLGQLLACPKCGSMVQIPQQTPSAEPTSVTPSAPPGPPAPPIAPITEAPPVLPPSSPASDEPEPLIQKTPRHASENSMRIILSIVFLSVALLLAAAYVAVLYRSSPEETPEPLPPVVKEAGEPPGLPKNNAYPEEPEPEEVVNPDEPEEEPDPIAIPPEDEPFDENISEGPLDPPPLEPGPEPDPPLDPQPIRARIPIDVSERLQLPIVGFTAQHTTLYDAATTLGNYAGIPLTWDVPGIRLFGISLEKPLRLDFGESTVGDVLESLLSQNHLAMLIEHEQIFIYPVAAADPTLREVRYDISGFLRTSSPEEGGLVRLSTARMLEMIPRLIAPFSWQPQGGDARLDSDGTVLIISQTEMNHKEIVRFFEMIRNARKMPLLSTADKSPQEAGRILRELFPERYCEETLNKPLTLHYGTPTPLAEIFRVLEPVVQLRFLVNHRTLNEAQAPFAELKGTVHVEKGTVRDAVQQLLHSVDQAELTYRIVDWNTVEILTRDAALLPEYAALESHHYGAVLRGQTDLTPEEMIAMLKNTVEPDSWAETTFGGGAVLLDAVSETFFLRQSQPVQRIVHVWLLGN